MVKDKIISFYDNYVEDKYLAWSGLLFVLSVLIFVGIAIPFLGIVFTFLGSLLVLFSIALSSICSIFDIDI